MIFVGTTGHRDERNPSEIEMLHPLKTYGDLVELLEEDETLFALIWVSEGFDFDRVGELLTDSKFGLNRAKLKELDGQGIVRWILGPDHDRAVHPFTTAPVDSLPFSMVCKTVRRQKLIIFQPIGHLSDTH